MGFYVRRKNTKKTLYTIMHWINLREDVIRISVRVQPKSSKVGLLGITSDGNSLRWGVSSAPIDGKANSELLNGIAKKLGIAKTKLVLAKGDKSRDKLIDISGISIEEISLKLTKNVTVQAMLST